MIPSFSLSSVCADERAEQDQEIRRDQLDLAAHEGQAKRQFLRRRGAVARRAPGHDIGDIDSCAVEADRRQHLVEQLPGAADERLADPILLGARPLADDHDFRIGRAIGENQPGRGIFQGAAVEGGEAVAQFVEMLRAPRLFAGARRRRVL